MSETERSLPTLLSELTQSLEELQGELEPDEPRLRPPSPRELARFTSEVTIPAVILLLETNVRALRLVQRALRIANGRETGATSTGSQTRERAVKLGQATLSQLDATLGDLQDALEGRPPEDDARQLLDRIRALEDDIEAELAAVDTDAGDADSPEGVEIDVDAELQSLKDDVENHGADEGYDDNE